MGLITFLIGRAKGERTWLGFQLLLLVVELGGYENIGKNLLQFGYRDQRV
jgi:hypothetical protein